MQYELTGLQEHTMSVAQPIGESGQTNFKINWAFSIDIDIPEDNLVLVLIDVRINVEDPVENPQIARFMATHSFSVKKSSISLTNGVESQKLFPFFATLVGISLGSMRGLVYARTHSVLGPSVFMPVVNPSDLLKKNLDRIVTNLKSKT